MLTHHNEIYSRPARTWFQSEKAKSEAQNASREQQNTKVDATKARDRLAGLSRRKKRNRLMREEDAKSSAKHETDAAVRAAKRSQRPSALGEAVSAKTQKQKKGNKKLKMTKALRSSGKGGAFGSDLSSRK